jgi:hypothetical protein
MTQEGRIRWLGGLLGVGFVVFGIVESGVALVGRDPIGFFWFPALCGGGVLVLLGVFKIVHPARASIALVAVGALAGALATSWTVIVPILALVLIVLVAGRATRAAADVATEARVARRRSGEGTRM